MKPSMQVTSDFTQKFNDTVKKFKRDTVLVGIPAAETKREDEDAQINNAALLALNNFGSPIQNIPPRPVMAIGIKNAQIEIAEQFKLAAVNALSKGLSALSTYYNRAGIIASTAIKKAINSQEGIAEPAASTLATRKAEGFKGTKALIVSGQMRNSITYVVKGED